MEHHQNLCILCCYSFQEKRSRFISNETKDCFQELAQELEFQIESIRGENGNLDLPFGEGITICGDCLSLVVVYVQRKALQKEKEEQLLQLQKQVCRSLEQLKSVVEDVRGYMNRLHNTISMGDVSVLERIPFRSHADLENARAFREKILSLEQNEKRYRRNGIQTQTSEAIFVKVEPTDAAEYLSDNENATLEYSDHENDSNIDAHESNKRLSTILKQGETDNTENVRNFPFSTSSEQHVSKDDRAVVVKVKKRRTCMLQKSKVKRKLLKFGNILSPEKAAAWKESLHKRISETQSENTRVQYEVGQEGCTVKKAQNFFQGMNGELKFCGVEVKIHENRRMLECTRCNKMYFEERDVLNADIQLETLMQNHILEKHCVPRKKKAAEEIDVIEYTSHTKTRMTFKLACKNKYSYTRRCGKQDAAYFRCDFRKGNCAASILHKNGQYIKLIKGWNADGFHTVHPPDIDRTNKQIALGKAKQMFLTDDSKTLDEVCSIIMKQSNEQALPISKFKRAMVYSKYGSRKRTPEEKINEAVQCCYCGQIYKEQRGLSRHITTQHHNIASAKTQCDKGKKEDDTQAISSCSGETTEKSARPASNQVQIDLQKSLSETGMGLRADGVIDSGSPIVCNDLSTANNFVNCCINPVMHQVGVSMVDGPHHSSLSSQNNSADPVLSESSRLELVSQEIISASVYQPSTTSWHQSEPSSIIEQNFVHVPGHHSNPLWQLGLPF